MAEKETSAGRLTALRNGLGMASLVPAAGAGVAAGVLRRNRRFGVDFFIERWLDTLFATTGVSFSVQGEENLWAKRPAVFIFNHRNNFDVLMTGKLVRRKFTSVGKKEAADNLLGRTLGKLIDGVFIDRSAGAEAVAALKPVEDAVAKGLSLIISPEGTRSPTGELMPFKKGPFRIAMAAKVPIVPIVFRNADDVGKREATVMRPATVDVVILPPIPVDDWKVETLDQHIADVRQQYLDTLANWPKGKQQKSKSKAKAISDGKAKAKARTGS
jgi:putative phosphoserine phosphatase / 1-acylglycerol-3-phosphate O-acyltransferase